jgi:hypothetical protein
MAYRGEDAGDVLEARTREGAFAVSLGANRITLAVGSKSLYLADRVATVVEQVSKKKPPRRMSLAIAGIVFARGLPREDLGLWIEATADGSDGASRSRTNMRRIFGVSPLDLFEPEGLPALAKLDGVATRLRIAVDEYAEGVGVWSARGVEIGAGHALDKVLLADYGEQHAIYARKLFRDRARLIATVHRDGRIVVPDGKLTHEVNVTSRFGITVRGDYIRFADRHGTDRARISVPWIGPEDREELAHRIGQLVHRISAAP